MSLCQSWIVFRHQNSATRLITVSLKKFIYAHLKMKLLILKFEENFIRYQSLILTTRSIMYTWKRQLCSELISDERLASNSGRPDKSSIVSRGIYVPLCQFSSLWFNWIAWRQAPMYNLILTNDDSKRLAMSKQLL